MGYSQLFEQHASVVLSNVDMYNEYNNHVYVNTIDERVDDDIIWILDMNTVYFYYEMMKLKDYDFIKVIIFVMVLVTKIKNMVQY